MLWIKKPIASFRPGKLAEVQDYTKSLKNCRISWEGSPIYLLCRYSPKAFILEALPLVAKNPVHISVPIERGEAYLIAKRKDLTATDKGQIIAHLFMNQFTARLASVVREGGKYSPIITHKTYYDVLQKAEILESATATILELLQFRESNPRSLSQSDLELKLGITIYDSCKYVNILTNNPKLEPHTEEIYLALGVAIPFLQQSEVYDTVDAEKTARYLAEKFVRHKISKQIQAKKQRQQSSPVLC